MKGGPRGQEPIAIVGIGCRFPGAHGPAELWRLLTDGRCTVGEIPSRRIGDLDKLHGDGSGGPGKILSRRGGYLDGLERFDAPFFGIAPVEAEKLDPQQRLLLETSWEALEDAGIAPERTRGAQVGVYVGTWLHDFETCLIGDPVNEALEHLDFYTTTGSGRYSLPGRLSFFYDWHGPSLSVDTACSSSLVALHLACRALADGEAEIALAGGVNVILSPYINVAYSQSRMLAPDGLCKFGDASANGYVRSEGCGLLVLKPLSRAIAAGDRIYATILGSAINNDGQSSGYMATPGVPGQRDMLRKAWADAGLTPAAAHYIEAHGTGTPAGDPVELGAIGAEAGAPRDAGRCLVGSIKTNLGHTEGAAGVAGAIKIALSMHHGAIPPSLHHVDPNPKIAWERDRLEVPRAACEWPVAPAERRGGVSGFGIAGTNAHVVLGGVEPSRESLSTAHASLPRLLPLSAASEPALRELSNAVADRLDDLGDDEDQPLEALLAGAARRGRLEHRMAAFGEDGAELGGLLRAHAAGELPSNVVCGRAVAQERGPVFVCSGVGAHWTGMARTLLAAEPIFRAAIERCDTALAPLWGESVLAAIESGEPFETTDRIQPAVFAIQFALAELLRAMDVRPAAVIGHSMGEIAAAAIAGALTPEDAARVIVGRSRFIAETSGQGAMVATGLTLDQARAEVKGYDGRLSAAVNNGPQSTVISGEPEALERLSAALASREVFCRPVKADFAAHSPQMDGPRDKLVPFVEGIAPRKGSLRFVSTLDVAERAGDTLAPTYWGRNVRETVRFAETIELLAGEGHGCFVELAPHAILSASIEQTLEHHGREAVVVRTLLRDEDDAMRMARAQAELFVAGVEIDPAARLACRDRWTPLPCYPWQRRRYWYTDAADQKRRRRSMGSDNVGTAWLGREVALSLGDGASLRELEIDPGVHEWLAADTVAGGPALTSACLLATALQALVETHPGAPVALENFRLGGLQWLEDERAARVQLTSCGDGELRFAMRAEPSSAAWTTLADARRAAPGSEPAVPPPEPLVNVERIEGATLYETVDSGEATHWVSSIARVDERFEARLAPIEGTMVEGFALQPGFLTAACQLAGFALGAGGSHVCRSVRAARFDPSTEAPQRAVGRRNDDGTVDVWLLDAAGRVALSLSGMRFEPIAEVVLDAGAWLHRVVEEPLDGVAAESWSGRRVAMLADEGRCAARLGELLETRGAEVVTHDSAKGCDEVIYLRGLDRRDDDPLRDVARRCAELATTLTAHRGRDDAPRFTLLTHTPEDETELAEGALDALVAAADQEDPAGRYRRLRFDRESLDAVPDALASAGGERRLRLSAAGCRALRWRETPAIGSDAPPVLRGTCLVTGGLGGIGRAIARRLVMRGAPAVVLIGRRGAHDDESRAFVESLAATGTSRVVAHAVDAADRIALDGLLSDIAADESLPPLRSVFHAAGIADGDFIEKLDTERFARTFAGKIGGALALHEATRSLQLDHFVLFSSIMATIDVPANANYGAANAWLDALAEHRAAVGLPALSIAWGPWDSVGMASEADSWIDRLRAGGMEPVPGETALGALERLLGAGVARAAVTRVDPTQWCESFPGAQGDPFLAAASDDSGEDGAAIRERLAAIEDGTERSAALALWVREEVARVLRFDPAQVEPRTALRNLGFDSLMTLQLRNRLERGLALSLPATLVFNYPSVELIAGYIAGRLDDEGAATTETTGESETTATAPDDSLAADSPPADETGGLDEEAVAEMSDDEVERMLAERIGDLDGI